MVGVMGQGIVIGLRLDDYLRPAIVTLKVVELHHVNDVDFWIRNAPVVVHGARVVRVISRRLLGVGI